MKKRFIVFVCIILGFIFGLLGCNKGPQPVPVESKIITSDNVRDFFSTNFMCGGVVGDNTYELPKKEWLFYDFKQVLLADYLEKRFVYIPQQWDCDKFSLRALSVMQAEHYKNRRNPNGIAFGEFWYIPKQNKKSGHALNFALILEKERVVITFFEPQTFEEVHLTEEEIHSAYFWRI